MTSALKYTYHVFNIEYTMESIDVWLLIQTLYYNIDTKYKTSSLLKQVTAELGKTLVFYKQCVFCIIFFSFSYSSIFFINIYILM